MEKKSKKKTQTLAYSRRQRENDTFTDIAQALPIQESAKDLDKASILRLAIHYLKLRDLIRDGNEMSEGDLESTEAIEAELREDAEELVRQVGELSPSTKDNEEPSDSLVQSDPTIADFLPNFSKDVVQALDGFLMVVSRDGRVLFSSESISNYLGLRQVDVIGVNVQDIIHPQDCSEVVRIFQSQGQDSEQVFDPKEPLRRKFVVRMRCAFTPSVRCITRCSNFKPIYCSCFLKFGKSGVHKGQFLGMVAFCKLATLSKIKEMVVGTFFKTKHSLDLSYTGVDTRIRWILGYDPSEMTGLKAYQYFHPQDLGVTSSCHMNLLSRGVSHSPCYRFMTRWGDWLWCRSKSQMVFNKNSHLPEGIVIYTWIVRVDEEDERMLAIKNGEDGESKRKTYKSFSDSISSSSGVSLDVSSLANPYGTPLGETTPTTPPSVPAIPLATSPSQGGMESALPYSPPLSAESSPMKASNVSSPQLPSCHMAGANVTTPPMGVVGRGGVSSPPMMMATGVMNPTTPPMGGMNQATPPMGMVGGVSSPPMTMQGALNPNTPPMGASSPPNMGMGGVSTFSSNNSSTCMKPFGVTSDVVDQSFLFDQAPLNQSFMMSPPYTPYVNQSPGGGGGGVAVGGGADSSCLPTYACSNGSAGASPPHCGTSTGTPSPLTFQNPNSAASSYLDSYSPPYSSTSAATPTYDHVITDSAPSNFPLLPPQTIDPFVTQQVTPTSNHPQQQQQRGMGGGAMPMKHTFPPVTNSHMTSLASTPSPSMEVRATFVPNANSTSRLSGYTESYSVPMSAANMADIFAVSDAEFSHKPLPPFAQAPPSVVKQNVINARQRYSGAAPTGHHQQQQHHAPPSSSSSSSMGGGATMISGQLAGHHVVHASVGGNNRSVNADDSISQWSQWLQGSAPAPVC